MKFMSPGNPWNPCFCDHIKSVSWQEVVSASFIMKHLSPQEIRIFCYSFKECYRL